MRGADSPVLDVGLRDRASTDLRLGAARGDSVNVGTFTNGQKQYLEIHRDAVLLKAHRKSPRTMMRRLIPQSSQAEFETNPSQGSSPWRRLPPAE
jgi:hypothetical protein